MTEIKIGTSINSQVIGGNVEGDLHLHPGPQPDVLNAVDMQKLADELEQLRKALRSRAETTEQDIAVAKVAEAETAARKSDKSSLLAALKNVGKWVVDTATEIGTSVAAEVIKKSLIP